MHLERACYSGKTAEKVCRKSAESSAKLIELMVGGLGSPPFKKPLFPPLKNSKRGNPLTRGKANSHIHTEQAHRQGRQRSVPSTHSRLLPPCDTPGLAPDKVNSKHNDSTSSLLYKHSLVLFFNPGSQKGRAHTHSSSSLQPPGHKGVVRLTTNIAGKGKTFRTAPLSAS